MECCVLVYSFYTGPCSTFRFCSNPPKIRLVRRNVHNGIVGARVRGAREAKFPIIAFIDSHAEVLPGWLEPLVYRIYLNRKTVVVPSLRSIDTHGLSVTSHHFWPPARGSFNWRMAFTHAGVDIHRDAVYFGLGLRDAPTSQCGACEWCFKFLDA